MGIVACCRQQAKSWSVIKPFYRGVEVRRYCLLVQARKRFVGVQHGSRAYSSLVFRGLDDVQAIRIADIARHCPPCGGEGKEDKLANSGPRRALVGRDTEIQLDLRLFWLR